MFESEATECGSGPLEGDSADHDMLELGASPDQWLMGAGNPTCSGNHEVAPPSDSEQSASRLRDDERVVMSGVGVRTFRTTVTPDPAMAMGRAGFNRLCSLRRDDGDSVGQGCFGQSIVVGDDSFEFVADVERRREMNRVECSQNGWIEPSCGFEDCRRDGNECHRVEHFPGPNNLIRNHATYGPQEFGADQIA